MILTGRPVEDPEAEEWGMVNRLVEDGRALEAAIELGKRIAEFPQRTVRTDRATVYDGFGERLEQSLKIEAWHGRKALETAEKGAEQFAKGAGRHGKGIESSDEKRSGGFD